MSRTASALTGLAVAVLAAVAGLLLEPRLGPGTRASVATAAWIGAFVGVAVLWMIVLRSRGRGSSS